MMHVGEYLLALAAIVLGLALTELATGLDRLVKRRRQVSFDPAPLLAAAMIFYAVLANLWAQYAHYHQVTVAPLSEGAGVVGTFMITYLMAAMVLPDDAEGKLDLGAHYDEIRRPFWLLFGMNVIAIFVVHRMRDQPLGMMDFITGGLGLAVTGIMLMLNHRVWRSIMLLAIIAVQVFSLGDLTISG